jgi:flagellin
MEVFIMSMVVRTNSMAMNANSALNKNNSTVAGNLQKLSTGFRINRAADDASGLAVSEKMKAQIKALDQAGKNAQDGASLIKTAEGYMGEIHDMLNRIVELAEKSANGTFETKTDNTTETYKNAATDRQAIQDEVDQLTTEIDRIAKTANFNQLKLLDGNLETSTQKQFTAADLGDLYIDKNGSKVKAADNLEDAQNATTFYNKGKKDQYDALTGDDIPEKAGSAWAASDFDDATYIKKGDDYVLAKENVDDVTDSTTFYSKSQVDDYTPATTAPTASEEVKVGQGLKLQIGGTSGAADKLEVSIMNFQTSSLFSSLANEKVNANDDGTGGVNIVVNNESDAAKTADITGLTFNVSNQDAASRVAEKVRDVINKVSSQRATLGAMENRLDYTMNNLDTASQNITDANSRIRDTDMAKTMMEYTQGNTLTQAAQAMLAQANQAPSQVLQLLQ